MPSYDTRLPASTSTSIIAAINNPNASHLKLFNNTVIASNIGFFEKIVRWIKNDNQAVNQYIFNFAKENTSEAIVQFISMEQGLSANSRFAMDNATAAKFIQQCYLHKMKSIGYFDNNPKFIKTDSKDFEKYVDIHSLPKHLHHRNCTQKRNLLLDKNKLPSDFFRSNTLNGKNSVAKINHLFQQTIRKKSLRKISSHPPSPTLSTLLQTQSAVQLESMSGAPQTTPLPRTNNRDTIRKLSAPQPGSLASNAAVLNALYAHAQSAGTKLLRIEIQAYVALGELAVRTIQQRDTPSDQDLVAKTPIGDVVLTPNMELARAISWYFSACAAQQDENQANDGHKRVHIREDAKYLTMSGTYRFNDPNYAIYQFLRNSPLAYVRISSHYNEMSASTPNNYLNVPQIGIEDYQRKLPGENGSILFDKLRENDCEQMFIKFEHHGVPILSYSNKDDMGEGSADFFEAFKRSALHAISYQATRSNESAGVERKEHAHKGILRRVIYAPYMEIIAMAEFRNLLEAKSTSKTQDAEIIKSGLSYIKKSLDQIRTKIIESDPAAAEQDALLTQITSFQAVISAVVAELGQQTLHLNIAQRGGESHLDMAPRKAHLEAAHYRLTHLAGDWANPLSASSGNLQGTEFPAGIHPDVLKEWDVHGITINGTVYPGRSLDKEHSNNNLRTVHSAYLQACGNDPLAADWISRFARQGLAEPLLRYLQKESLGEVGEGIDFAAGSRCLTITTSAKGSVEIALNLVYHNNPDAPMVLKHAVTGAIIDMEQRARLEASVTLCFENLSSFTAGAAPEPVITVPMQYSFSDFNSDVSSDYEIIDHSDVTSDT